MEDNRNVWFLIQNAFSIMTGNEPGEALFIDEI